MYFREAMPPHGRENVIVIDVRTFHAPYDNTVHMPCTTLLRLYYGDIIGLFVSLFLAVSTELFPELLEIRVELLCVGHVLCVGQSYPVYAAVICRVAIDQVTKLLEALPKAVRVVGSCVGLLELIHLAVGQIDVLSCRDFLNCRS